MRSILLSASLILAMSASLAQARPDSLAMSCAAASDLVRRQGAVVIGTGPDLYERFVANSSYCGLVQITEPAWIPTKDNRQCLVGKRCVERPIKLR